MSHAEFTGWQDRYDRMPWGDKADDARHQHLMSVHCGKDTDVNVFSLNRTEEYKDEIRTMMLEEPLKPWEFLNKDDKADEAQSYLLQMKAKYTKNG